MLIRRKEARDARARHGGHPGYGALAYGIAVAWVAAGACGSVEAVFDADTGDDGEPPGQDSGAGEVRDADRETPDAGEGAAADAAAPPEPGWREVTPEEGEPNPGPRQEVAMAYDAARKQVILFGGRDENNDRPGGTWAWDGESWEDVTPEGDSPVARDRAAMAYDASRERIVLFGGVDDEDRPKSTWEWDGESWHEVTPADAEKPGRKVLHDMAYDESRELVVLYSGRVAGGTNDLMDSDTWEWDGESWEDVTPSGEENSPPPAYGHKMAYDPVRELVIVHGGRTDEGLEQRDTWEWNGFTWVELASNPPRRQHAIVRDSERERVVLFGGLADSDPVGDTWIWAQDTWTEITDDFDGEAPEPRFGHAMAYDAARDRVVLYGGRTDFTGDTLADTWEFFGGTE